VLVARREALLHQVKAELEQQYGVQVTTITADLDFDGTDIR
jgi:short-subunit dehydrogenase